MAENKGTPTPEVASIGSKGALPSLAAVLCKLAPFPPRYEITGVIGAGGMGWVLEARDTLLKRSCAIKVIKKEILGNEILLKRFKAEAELTASVNNPNIIEIFDISVDPANPFFVMEKFSSRNLRDFVLHSRELSLEKQLGICKQIIKALKAAHKKNLLHRDIKPENVLVGEDFHIKLIDFGLSLLHKEGDTRERITKVGSVFGSPDYMSPEQCMDASNVTSSADIYSAGATLFFLFSREPPFADPDNSPVQVMMRQCYNPRPRLADKKPRTPAELSDLIERMMAVAPEERPNHDQALEILERVEKIHVLAQSRELLIQSGVFNPGPPTPEVSAPAPITQPPTSRRTEFIAALIIAIFAGGALLKLCRMLWPG